MMRGVFFVEDVFNFVTMGKLLRELPQQISSNVNTVNF